MNRRPVLLVIEGTYPWYRGGVSEWVHQYLTFFRDQPFFIVQVATDEYQNASVANALYRLPNHVQQFERIAPPNLKQPWENESTDCLNEHNEALLPLFQKSKLVHIANTGVAGWLGKEMAKKCNRPLVLTEHALYWKEIEMGAVALECGYKVPGEGADKKDFATMFRHMAREIYSEADVVVSVSECNMAEQKRLGAQNVRYIPNGIPADWLKRSPTQWSSTLRLGWIGRCAEMKNPLKFFEVIDSFEEKGISDVQFLMLCCDAGETELEEVVKRKAKEDDRLTLRWNRSAGEYIDFMDALCITSHNESQPLVMFEALSRKVLPVGWKVGDVTPKYGLVVEAGQDTAHLVAEITNLWQQPDQWKKEVQKRFWEVEKHHTWNNIFKKYSDIFKSVDTN